MNTKNVMQQLNALKAELDAIIETLAEEVKPHYIAFVNFHPGGRSFAYTANNTIKEGDIVYVPTASRGNVAGVVSYVNNYAEDEIPFHPEKSVIGKLDEMDLPVADIVRMTTELAPAIANKDRAKATLLAWLNRRTTTVPAIEEDTPDTEDTHPFDDPDDENDADTTNVQMLMDNEELEGDGSYTPDMSHPGVETTIENNTIL